MRELRQTTTIFIISCLVLATLIGVYVFLFLDLKARNDAILVMHQDLLEKEHQQRERLELERTIVTTEADRQTLESYFISGEKAVSFLETLESYGKSANVAFEIMTVDINTKEAETVPTAEEGGGQPASAQPQDEQPSLIISAHALGRFRDVYQLLLLLENAPYEFEFDRVRLRHSSYEINTSATGLATDNIPKMPGIDRITPSDIPYLWDFDFTIKLLTFTPSQSE